VEWRRKWHHLCLVARSASSKSNPHGLMSAEHGQISRKSYELLCEHLPMLADDGMPTVVLLTSGVHDSCPERRFSLCQPG